MNSSMQNTITTNLRIPDGDLQQYRVVAAELGISFNDLVLDALRISTSMVSLQRRSGTSKLKAEYSLDQLSQLPRFVREAERSGAYQKHHKDVGLSAEDSEIYE
ncbi:MAG: hypothetical protein A3A82_00785 [Candidatus Pacebacteria bacterium RIFCSPLOWO2_01_FULL_47_12]|nr:MAG: hypothetical protein A3J60_02855 [Candidatus Pacebacteria bacterium RIFCSPHIGHO2_02_FULL_46_9]OGJ37984.1 MAG: hypothetical protein A3A82_00785 [Candidatus Pacebacteria bacterium RIFCSPLOWO2_01_FULL_47_12]